MSDKATMLRETVEAFADLHTMFDGLTEEQASRVWLGVLGVRDTLIHIHYATLRGCGDQTSQAAERISQSTQSRTLAPYPPRAAVHPSALLPSATFRAFTASPASRPSAPCKGSTAVAADPARH